LAQALAPAASASAPDRPSAEPALPSEQALALAASELDLPSEVSPSEPVSAAEASVLDPPSEALLLARESDPPSAEPASALAEQVLAPEVLASPKDPALASMNRTSRSSAQNRFR
jgi:hypothetical protein